jgi:hypothetical protein
MDQISSKTLSRVIAGVAILIVVIGIGTWLNAVKKLGYVGLNPQAAIWLFFLAVVLVLAGLAFVVFALMGGCKVVSREGGSSGLDQIEPRTLRIIVIGAGILVFATFIWAGLFVAFRSDSNTEVTLPVVIIAGLVVLVMVLGLLTFVFSVLKLSDSKEALGLPSGSIRAVIALMLLVIFAIVSIFLYSDVAGSGRLQKLENLTAEDVTNLAKQVEVALQIEQKQTSADGKSLPSKYIVHYRAPTSRAGEDLAKQLIVLLGTLVTAVSSFYFGSASIAAATKPAGGTGGPSATIVTPSNFKPGGDPQQMTIGGANLSKVGLVKLTQDGKTPIIADTGTIVATETGVVCKVQVPKDADHGPWDVVVSDNANNFSIVPKSLTIGSPSPPDVARRPAQVPELKANDAVQALALDAQDVPAGPKSLKLTLGSENIPAEDGTVEKTNTGVTCKIKIPKDAKQDQWSVVVVGADDKPITLKDRKVKIGPA